ncbi:hypothetical protein [Methanorbis furvi]|uniref:hypothetical protein n=1 Tax=Methanorbis furvi TaxID=3028299 RepID=UPI0030B897B3
MVEREMVLVKNNFGSFFIPDLHRQLSDECDSHTIFLLSRKSQVVCRWFLEGERLLFCGWSGGWFLVHGGYAPVAKDRVFSLSRFSYFPLCDFKVLNKNQV